METNFWGKKKNYQHISYRLTTATVKIGEKKKEKKSFVNTWAGGVGNCKIIMLSEKK